MLYALFSLFFPTYLLRCWALHMLLKRPCCPGTQLLFLFLL